MTSSLWIYLSPHLDDAVFSCGGMIWQQVQAGSQVEIWSVFSGDPPRGDLTPFASSLHQRWGINVPSLAERRVEDLTAASKLGAIPRHMNYPECIYRRLPESGQPLVNAEEDLWQPIHPSETTFLFELGTQLAAQLPDEANLVCPLAIGDHVDHRLVFTAAQNLNIPRYYYPDFPYAAHHEERIQAAIEPTWKLNRYNISADALEAWIGAAACYTSQISTFWDSIEGMQNSLQDYWTEGGGSRIWLSQS